MEVLDTSLMIIYKIIIVIVFVYFVYRVYDDKDIEIIRKNIKPKKNRKFPETQSVSGNEILVLTSKDIIRNELDTPVTPQSLKVDLHQKLLKHNLVLFLDDNGIFHVLKSRYF